MMLSSRVPPGLDGLPVAEFLAKRFTYLNAAQWQDRIREGRILVNGVLADPATILRKNDEVTYQVEKFVEPKADLTYCIVFEDEWIMCVNKPGNLLVHKAGRSVTSNLVYLLRHVSGNPAYRFVHSVSRLDRETSGLVLFSKDPECLRLMHRDFAAHNLTKEYYAVVSHPPEEQSFTVDLPIGQDSGSSIHYKFRVDPINGKPAHTDFTVLDTCGDFALIKAVPVTGRTHQIRIHCLASGCPVVGDKLYGMSEQEYLKWREAPDHYDGKLLFHRQALHCSRLTFIHPMLKTPLTISAAIPKDMADLMIALNLKIR
jgi:23S rRNA pseudouridine1911/1915/1917 synthase